MTRKVVFALAALLALVVTAASEAAWAPRTHSFGGSCSLQGTTYFNPPVTNTEAKQRWHFEGRGSCTGTVDGRSLADTPIVAHIGGGLRSSCLAAESNHSFGWARFTMGTARRNDDAMIRFSFQGRGTLTEIDFTLRGRRGGSAHGHATFLTTRTPPDTALRCSGTGVDKVPTDVSVQTDSPLVSGG